MCVQEDMLLRAVRFLDTMIQRDNLQKASFLKDLGSIWPRVDSRVLKFRMIPPLLAEARTEALQPVLLPLLLSMVEKQDDEVCGHFITASTDSELRWTLQKKAIRETLLDDLSLAGRGRELFPSCKNTAVDKASQSEARLNR